jgi:hypothetical protein
VSDGLPAFCKVMDGSSTTGTARLVLLAIASYAQPDGTGAWPSLEAIRRRAGVRSDRTVRRHIGRLVDAGELTVVYKGGPRGCNAYTVTVDLDTHMSTSAPGHLDVVPRDVRQ